MSPWLIVIISIGMLAAVWWVLFGERKQKEMLRK